MAFWADLPEPSRQFRWYIEFTVPELKNLRYALKKAARPTMKISEVKHKYLNHEFYYPGRVEWDPITISFAAAKYTEEKASNTNTSIIEVLRNSGYFYPRGIDNEASTDLKSISKKNAVAAVTGGTTLQLVQINADGDPEEIWYLKNAFFTDIKFDTLEYASEEILNVDCTIKYDWASYKDNTGATI